MTGSVLRWGIQRMYKLYAVRNKRTGKLIRSRHTAEIFLFLSPVRAWEFMARGRFRDCELVRFRR